MEDFTDTELFELLPEVVRISKSFIGDKEFEKECEYYGGEIEKMTSKIIAEKGTFKANALILALFLGIKTTCNQVMKLPDDKI